MRISDFVFVTAVISFFAASGTGFLLNKDSWPRIVVFGLAFFAGMMAYVVSLMIFTAIEGGGDGWLLIGAWLILPSPLTGSAIGALASLITSVPSHAPHLSAFADSNSQLKFVGFGKAMVWTVLITVIMWASGIIARNTLATAQLSTESYYSIESILKAAVVIATLLLLETRQTNSSVASAIRALGLKRGNSTQLRLVVLGAVPLVIGCLIVFFGLNESAALELPPGLLIVRSILSFAIVEEVLYRGFIFRHLRQGRSFWSAASLSAVLVTLAGLLNMTAEGSLGFSMELILFLSTSAIVSFVLVFPLALLFEIGGFSILGGAIWHGAISSLSWLMWTSDADNGSLRLVATLTSAAIVTFAAIRARNSRPDLAQKH